MGEVYRARDRRLGRDVAIKVLPESLATDPESLARFEREARTVAGLNHPNIVTLFSVEDEDGIRFLTMELVEGVTLDRLLSPGGLDLSRLLDLSIPLVEAVGAAHEKGIVHRDLKPGNVMVTHDGRVKVLDFGLAKVAAAEELALDATQVAAPELHASEDGRVIGTAPYMAPEQVLGGSVDAHTDLFALGIILYELASGRRPFPGETREAVCASIIRDAPVPLQAMRPGLPAEFGRIVSQCLEKEPRARVRSATVLCNELRRMRRASELAERGVVAPSAAPGIASIAVLPFVNRSRDDADEYFSDGLADEMIGMLSKIRGLRVAARTASFRFKATKEDLATIGRLLNVATILDGSVRKAGDRVRISVQLVEIASGDHLWSETYDRTLNDIFAVQDDIAGSVVKELRATLLGEPPESGESAALRAEVARTARGRGTNAEAYRLFLQGRHFADRGTREDVAKAIGHLREAVRLDPEFALAWAELGAAYGTEAGRGWVPVEEGYGRDRAAVEHALVLEPDLAEGHARLGRIQFAHEWDWKGAERSFRRARELAPGDPVVLGAAGVLAQIQGRFEEAIDLVSVALEHDPLRSGSYTILGLTLYAAGRLSEAERAYRTALELAPQRGAVHAYVSLVLLAQGRGDEARSEAMGEQDEAYRLWAVSIIEHAAGRAVESDDALRSLVEKYADDCAYQIAEVCGARGEVDAAFAWLERAYEQRDGGLSEMKISPSLRSLHGDPRWGAFLKKMGLED
jgi:TolB-like protein/tetratricopeptide (TPR) repeat protein